ncbi:MAG: phosphoglycerate mutase family protein [Gemmatimonadaceae bacterium]
MTPFKLLFPLALASLLFSQPNSFTPPVTDTVVLVVRHAEKSGPSGDVPLSAAGEARAQALAEVARQAGVQAVITTQFQRTRQTAAPLASSLGIRPQVIEARGPVPEHAREVAAAIRARHAGQTVLVVGHSNTVSAIVAALGAPAFPDLCDEEYDHLYTVIVASEGSARLVRSRFGAPSTITATCAAMAR